MERLVAHRVIADKYRLDRALAAGGMGSVWAAWNTQLDVPVAVKFMAQPLVQSQELVARFEREARAAAQIRSSHVVQIFEHGIDGTLPYIVMELLEGEDLGARMRRVGPFSIEETARVVTGVCKALRRAHAMGIVHRDLKPANVFLARSDDDDEETVKVLDFGVVKSLAEAVESGVTKTGELIGTPSYMSPEQARSTKQVDHRSDLWSLGIIAYRALTASLPFPKDEGLNRLMRICNEPVPPPSTLRPDLGPDVDAFFARALAIDPDARFQTAREMSDAMKALAGLPTSSRTDRSASYGDGGPPSSTMYPAHAYVYTCAPESDHDRAPGARRPGLPDVRSSTYRVSSPDLHPDFTPAPEARGRSTRPPAGPGDTPTRVSNVHAVSVRTSRPASVRPPISIVTGALAGAEGPLPSLSPGDLDALSTAGLARSPATAARLVIARPRLALGAALAVMGALGALGFVLLSPSVSSEGSAPAASAANATILFATAAVSADTPAAGRSIASASPAATPPPREPAPSAPAPEPSARPTEPAPSAPAPEAAPGAPAEPDRGADAPASAPAVQGSARPTRWWGRGPSSPGRREGGIGRRPTY